MSDDILLEARGVTKTFIQGNKPLHVLSNLNMKLERGELSALVGPSGSGKSTLLQILGLLDKPTSGTLRIGGEQAENMNDKARTNLRRHAIGFVYQFHHLLPEFNALENVAMPQIIAGVKKKEAHEKAEGLLSSLGLGARLDHRPAKLSGGERQRVAVARALVLDPPVILADEPTGNLDPETGDRIADLLLEMNRSRGTTLVVVTHSVAMARKLGRSLRIEGGQVHPEAAA